MSDRECARRGIRGWALGLAALCATVIVAAQGVWADPGQDAVEIAAVGSFNVINGSTTSLTLPDDGAIVADVVVMHGACPAITDVELTGALNTPLTAAVVDGEATFSGVEFASGTTTLTAQGLNSGGQSVGNASSEVIDITAESVANIEFFQDGGAFELHEEPNGDIVSGVDVTVTSTAVSSVEISGLGLSLPLTQSVSGSGLVEFTGVDFNAGSNTLTLKAFDSSSQLLTTQTMAFDVAAGGDLSYVECMLAVAAKKRLRICSKVFSSPTRITVSFNDGFAASQKICPKNTTCYFYKSQADPVGTCVTVTIKVGSNQPVNKMRYVK